MFILVLVPLLTAAVRPSALQRDTFWRSRRAARLLRESFEPADVEDAASVSELGTYLANMTAEKCEELEKKVAEGDESLEELNGKMKEGFRTFLAFRAVRRLLILYTMLQYNNIIC